MLRILIRDPKAAGHLDAETLPDRALIAGSRGLSVAVEGARCPYDAAGRLKRLNRPSMIDCLPAAHFQDEICPKICPVLL